MGEAEAERRERAGDGSDTNGGAAGIVLSEGARENVMSVIEQMYVDLCHQRVTPPQLHELAAYLQSNAVDDESSSRREDAPPPPANTIFV